MSGCAYGHRNYIGYHTNRYGREVPEEILMWASQGTSIRHKGDRDRIVHHYVRDTGYIDEGGNRVYRIKGRRYSRNGNSTGYIKGARSMELANALVLPKAKRESKNYIYEHTIEEARKHGCQV